MKKSVSKRHGNRRISGRRYTSLRFFDETLTALREAKTLHFPGHSWDDFFLEMLRRTGDGSREVAENAKVAELKRQLTQIMGEY